MGCAGCGDGGSIASKAVLASNMMQVVTDFVGILLGHVWTSKSNREYKNMQKYLIFKRFCQKIRVILQCIAVHMPQNQLH